MKYRQLMSLLPAAVLASFVAAAGCNHSTAGEQKRISPSKETAVNETAMNDTTGSVNVSDKVTKSDQEWRRLLTSEQYRVTRECGTEPAFTGIYYDFHGKGTYRCVACGNELFSSDTKFDSGSGWPSFWAPLAKKGVTETIDKSHGMARVEVRCSRCGAHLGHVFEDGPKPTGLRYCINSAALDFVDEDSTGAK